MLLRGGKKRSADKSGLLSVVELVKLIGSYCPLSRTAGFFLKKKGKEGKPQG
jgi:hypothetical protein